MLIVVVALILTAGCGDTAEPSSNSGGSGVDESDPAYEFGYDEAVKLINRMSADKLMSRDGGRRVCTDGFTLTANDPAKQPILERGCLDAFDRFNP